MNKKALLQYLSALILFGLNGIVASHIAMNGREKEKMSLPQILGAVCMIGGAMIGELVKPKRQSSLRA